MSYFIDIHIPGTAPHRIPLSGSSGTVGSARSCQIPIEHHEVSAQAMILDIRGGDFWIQNLNTYSIYVGLDEVTPKAWSPWTANQTIQLTQSVSLTLGNEKLAATSASDKTKGEVEESKSWNAGKLFQLLLICACFLGAGFLLFGPKSDVAGVIDKEFDFNQIVETLQSQSNDIEYDTVRRYLQQAWMADRRWRTSRPETVMRYYEMLVNHHLVRENPKGDPTLDEIADYAKRRLRNLRFRK
jgi:hypothetical protein